VNNDTGYVTREALLGQVWRWGTESPTAVLQTTPVTSRTVQFTAVVSGSATDITQYRWDMGDGTPIFTTTTAVVSHTYGLCSPSGYTARVEVRNEWGNTAVAQQENLVPCTVGLSLTTTVGLNGQCGATNALTVTTSVPVDITACYTLANSGEVALDRHALSDTVWGSVPLTSTGHFILAPQASAVFTAVVPVAETQMGVATWSAERYVGGDGTRYTAVVSHTVTVLTPTPPFVVYSIFLPAVVR
jgi:hypothetical protein